ncbi:I78 family peptidase inhibitor [Chachezhania sediminis]|uniref:I78 family peptidase inhibitor n=1 Tax=Chachezhania sediminis TaxID=2599291 RepID=UPI00131B1EE0|nr:I78 family peptidase inhibitor [Chachezhania sediminis]
MKRISLIMLLVAACGPTQAPMSQTVPGGAAPAAGVSGPPPTDTPFQPSGEAGAAAGETGDAAAGETVKVPDMCGADTRQGQIGSSLSDHQAGLPEGTRIIDPSTIVAQDYNPQRLNVNVTYSGLIMRVWCG